MTLIGNYAIYLNMARHSKREAKQATEPIEQLAKQTLTPEVVQKQTRKPDKQYTKLSELPEKQQAYALLRESGLPIQAAGKALQVSKQGAYNMESKVKNLIKDDSKLVSLARKNLKKLAQGQKYGEIETIKDSTSLSAINAIIDRSDPVIKHVKTESVSFNVTYDITDLE